VPPLPHYGGRAPTPAPYREEPAPYEELPPRHEAAYAPRYDAWPDERRWDDDPTPSRYHDDHDRYDDDRYDDDRYDDDRYDDDRYEYDGYDQYDDRYDYDDEHAARTNRMAIWGFVLAFLFAPLGIIFSAIGLSQARRRGERGRGLAIAGVIVSLVWLAGAAAFAVAVGKDVADQVSSILVAQDDALDQAAVGTAPTAPPPTTVLQACTTLMPILVGAQGRMTDTATTTDGVEVIADMRAAVEWAGATPDAAFQQHLQTLEGDLQTLIDATRTGDVPEGLVSTLTDDSFVVGKDCGLSGWTQ
jgi:hypothetical protein